MKSLIKDKASARQYAIDWQKHNSNTSISYGELYICNEFFRKLGKKFGLLREFKENGII